MPKLNLTDLAIQRLKTEEGQTRYFDKTTPGFGILVGKTKKTFFVIHGKDRRMQTIGAYEEGGITLKEARQAAKGILLDPAVPKAKKSDSEAVEAYLKARKPHVKAVTYQHYAYYLHALDFKVDIAYLTKGDIKTGLAKWEGKKRAQNACHAALRTFINWCVEEELIDRNPLYRAKSPNKVPSRPRILTDDEIVKIWHATDFKPYGYLVRLALLTAGRKMEVRRMQVEDDLIVFKNTKNKTDHHLPITPLVRQHYMPGPYTFDNHEREKVRLDERSGVTDWTLHDLRRTWAYLAGRLGIRPEVIERVLNHKRTGIVEVYQRYQYIPEMREALLTVEAFILTITKPGQLTPGSRVTQLSGVRDETAKQESVTREDKSQPTTPSTT